jgi:hypothetical protein
MEEKNLFHENPVEVRSFGGTVPIDTISINKVYKQWSGTHK